MTYAWRPKEYVQSLKELLDQAFEVRIWKQINDFDPSSQIH
jgi:hypothetical protein